MAAVWVLGFCPSPISALAYSSQRSGRGCFRASPVGGGRALPCHAVKRSGCIVVFVLRLLTTRGFPPSRVKPAALRRLGFYPRFGPSALFAAAQQQPSLQPQLLLLQQPQPQPQPLLLLPPQQQQQQPLLLPPQLFPPPQQQHSRRIRMMIHQQPPPKPPLLPQHMICHLTFDVPVTETGSDAAERKSAAPEPSPVASGPAAGFLSVSVSYYVGA